jgi:hypothetical protein
MSIAKKYLQIRLVLGVLALFAVAAIPLGAGEQEHENEFVFSSIDVPGAARTTLQGINDAGEISGIFLDARGSHGFILRAAVCDRERTSRGDLIVVDYPGAAWTYVYGINAQGDVVGIYGRPGEPDPLFAPTVAMHGFLRSRKGQFTDIHYPDHLYEIPQRITSTRIVLGCYHDTDFMDSMYGFTRSPDGSFTRLSVPNSMNTGATPDGSIVVGIYGGLHAFLLDHGSFLSFDVPGSTLTQALDVNPQGDVVGHFQDSSGFHGFLRNENGEFTTLNFPGSNNTQARGINARSEIVGRYTDCSGRTHGFLARPREHDHGAEP